MRGGDVFDEPPDCGEGCIWLQERRMVDFFNMADTESMPSMVNSWISWISLISWISWMSRIRGGALD